jgi:hypothetical protein
VTLSSIVKNWLASGGALSIFNYTWTVANYPSNNLSASTVTGTYSTTMVNSLVAGTHLKQPDSTYVKFGVGVIQQADGRVKLQVEFAK